MNIEEAWTKTVTAIGTKVGSQTFDLWFKPLKLIHLQDEQIVLEVPNKFFKEWIEDHYPGLITETMQALLKKQISVKFKIFDKKEDPVLKKIETKQENRRAKLASLGIFLSPKFIFDTFVVGSSNQFANAAARAIADAPGRCSRADALADRRSHGQHGSAGAEREALAGARGYGQGVAGGSWRCREPPAH